MQVPRLVDCISTAIDKICESTDFIPIIGLSGPQGSGKTTALNALYKKSTKRIAILGIDDFYLTKAERIDLAKAVSPLCKTRGSAGTHDITLIEKTLESLMSATPSTRTPLICFDKVHDVYRFTFEPAGALEITNEYSGLAVAPAHLYRLRRSLACMPHVLNLAQWRIIMTKYEPPPFAAYVGIDWADKKHDLCIQVPADGTQEFKVIPHRANSMDEWLHSLYERVNGPIAVRHRTDQGSAGFCTSKI
jgi:hypothetical protein